MLRHMEKEVVGDSQCGFTRGKSCLTNLVTFYGGAPALVDRGRADLCQAFDVVTCDTPLPLNWRDTDMRDGLQQVSHETGGIQIDTKQEEEQ